MSLKSSIETNCIKNVVLRIFWVLWTSGSSHIFKPLAAEQHLSVITHVGWKILVLQPPFISHPMEQIPLRNNYYSLNGLSDFLQALLPHQTSFRTPSDVLSTPSRPIDSYIDTVDVSKPISVPLLVLTFPFLHKTVCIEQITWHIYSQSSWKPVFSSLFVQPVCGFLS